MSGTTKPRNIFFKIRNVIGPVIALGLILFPAMSMAQKSRTVKEINSLVEKNTPALYAGQMLHLEIDEADSLIFSMKNEEGGYSRGIYMGDVICMNTLFSYQIHRLNFYTKDKNDSVKNEEVYCFENAESMKVLLRAFNKLFEEQGFPVPPTSCPNYENDRFALKFEIRISDHPHRIGVMVSDMDTVFEGYTSFRYLNGNLRLERNMKDGKLSGIQKSYWENGVLSSEGEYQDGIAEGIHTLYYPTGGSYSRINYVEGRQHGEALMYYEDGTIMLRIMYQDGKVQSHEFFNEDGTPRE